MNLQAVIDAIAAEVERDAVRIEREADAKRPEDAPGPFGMALATRDGVLTAGAADIAFPIQSISKVFALDLALRQRGDRVFEQVGCEPSGDPFNSLIDLERTQGVPRNPFINAGALAVVDMLVEDGAGRDAVLDLIRDALGDRTVGLDEAVLHEGGDLNRAMLSFMKHHGNTHADIDAVMAAYVTQCAIRLDCAGLALAGRFLARTRLGDGDDERAQRMRTVLALMMTCGHYDGSGNFAVRVGLPSKSGVGGGILAIAPERAAIAVWSPNLDQQGNSILGTAALALFAERTGWSVFGPPLA